MHAYGLAGTRTSALGLKQISELPHGRTRHDHLHETRLDFQASVSLLRLSTASLHPGGALNISGKRVPHTLLWHPFEGYLAEPIRLLDFCIHRWLHRSLQVSPH